MDATEVKGILSRCGVTATPNRELVARALAESGRPVTPQELLDGLDGRMNRVTLYRILDLFVESGVATRHNAGERAFRYCLGGHGGHAHFTCVRCGHTQCLDSRALDADLDAVLSHLSQSRALRVDTAELRFGGVCEGCLGA